MKRLLGTVTVILLVLFGVMVIRTLRVAQPAASVPAATAAVLVVDTAGAAQRLAGAIRFPTVSLASGGPIDTAAFLALHQYLQRSFPLVHATLTRETVAGLSLLYRWAGTDPALPPVVLMGHLDVVPVPEPNLAQWTHPPFSGDLADCFVWGHGTLDDTTTVLYMLEAAVM